MCCVWWCEGMAQAFRYRWPSDVSGDNLGSLGCDNPGGWMSRGGNGSEASTAERSPVHLFWKNTVFGSWCLFETHPFAAAALHPSDDCMPTSSRALCSVALSFNAFAILYTPFSSHRLFQFLLPLLLISKYVLLIPHLWKLPSSLQHFQTSSRLAKPSATWLAASLLHSVSLVYIHSCISTGTLWMA